MERMTWTDGPVDAVTLNKGVRDEIEYLLTPPSCQRVGAPTSALSSGEWHFVPFAVSGSDSYDNTGDGFGVSAIKLYAPEDGLYEINVGIQVRSTTGAVAPQFCFLGLAVNAIQPADCTNYPITKIACNPRGTTTGTVGVGTSTVPMSTGQWVCVGIYATEGPYTTESKVTRIFMRRVGDHP